MRLIFLHTCATCSELPSDISIMLAPVDVFFSLYKALVPNLSKGPRADIIFSQREGESETFIPEKFRDYRGYEGNHLVYRGAQETHILVDYTKGFCRDRGYPLYQTLGTIRTSSN